jgi:YVTN family beta-propeller protein
VSEYGHDVIVIDGVNNQVLATVAAGCVPCALCYDPANDKVYCANYQTNDVTVIHGASNQVDTTIGVGYHPTDMVWNPVQNRVYVANYGSFSISVLSDSGGSPLRSGQPMSVHPGCPTIVRGRLNLVGKTPAVLFDMSGKRVANLVPGANDVSRLAPGVYFVRDASGVGREAWSVAKVVLTR